MPKKRILIADDHSAIRNGIKHILSPVFNYIEFGEATDAIDVVRKIDSHIWDLIILDINLPGRSGLDAIKFIKEKNPELPILVFSFYKEEQVAIRAFRSGAHGYLSKDASDSEIIKAVNLLLNGRKYVPASVSDQMISRLQAGSANPHEILSGREYQILMMIINGKTVSQMAEELNLSTSTIHTYRSRILEKMHVKDNADLISYAIQNNLIGV